MQNKQFDLRQNNHPTIFVIFGITGDLANRKLLPALLTLYSKRLLPNRFAIVGYSRRAFSREEFREYIRSKINIRPGQFKEEDVKHFLDRVSYEQGFFDNVNGYSRLATALERIDESWGQCSNKLFHLSVPPDMYAGILTQLSKSGLTKSCADLTGWTRILIEKPFGNNIKTAMELDLMLGKLFKEEQIFRIDHYLAKEALQNIVAFRFSNSMFEPIWNRDYIDKIHIKIYENKGIEGRGAYYDPIGALKDMGQNHMLMMLAMIAMDKPKSFMATEMREKRAAVLKKMKLISTRNISSYVARGQYAGYLNENGVSVQSNTETYFRIESYISSARWKGVPFFLESGKYLSDNKTEIDIYFKNEGKEEKQNILTFRIQPEECIKIRFMVKTPGYEFTTEPKTLKFKYADIPTFHDMPDDYGKLIHDAFLGDQTLFASTDEIMASWKYVTPILENMSKLKLNIYEKGVKEIE